MGVNPSKFKGAKNPVEQVSWKDAVSFCRILTDMPKEKAAGRAFRLPTEAEWEYACRATSSAAFCFGDSAESLEEYGWFRDGLVGITHSVGLRRPNRWGLYDMHGNVSEWCQDEYEPYTSSEETDPQGPSVGSSRVFRGGGWFNAAGHCRSAHRQRQDLSQRYSFCGFRVAMSLPAKQPASTPSK